MGLDDVPDHYATLELEPDCSIEDINRAYKKLGEIPLRVCVCNQRLTTSAMKNHPDRNRGHEQEAVARFQAVQAAHEVLKEEGSRRQYDLSRRLPTANGSASARRPAQRGNPYKATSNFPPPPMRTNPSRQAPNTANRGAQRGTEGFTHFPPPPPPRPQPRTSTNKDAKDRANMFEAWQSMHGRRSPQRKAAPTASPGTSTPQDQSAYGSNLDPRSQPQRSKSDDAQQKSAYSQQRSANTEQGGPRRGGFDPSAPTGDERPASTSGYSQSHVRYDHSSAAAYTQRGPAPTAKRPPQSTDFNATRQETADQTRANAGYTRGPPPMPDTSNPSQEPERGPFGRPRPRQRNDPIVSYSTSDSDDIESAAASAQPRTSSTHEEPDMTNRPKAMPRSRRSGTGTPLRTPSTPSANGAKDGSNMYVK